MSSVIKSPFVVDSRDENGASIPAGKNSYDRAVIKNNHFYPENYTIMPHIPSRDSYRDELNRLLVEIEDAKKERGEIEGQIERCGEELRELEAEREKLRKYEGLNIEEEVAHKIQAAEKEAEQILRTAEEEAQKNALAAMDAMKSQGYLDGLEQGANEARQRVWDENRAGIEAISRMLEELSGVKEEIVAENEGEIVDLVLAVAEKVIGKQLKEEPKSVVDMLREVMEANHREEYIKIVISKDLMPVEARISDQIKKVLVTLGQQVDVVIDPEGGPGGLRVETAGGFTDLSVGVQLENISDILTESRIKDGE